MILSSFYFAPVSQFALYLQKGPQIIREVQEHYVKQSYRNRCKIMAANRILDLSIPIKRHPNNSPINTLEISYEEDWQTIHWRSIASAYSKAPFFEFYADHYEDILLNNKKTKLIEFNTALENQVLKDLKIPLEVNNSIEYTEQYPDWRCLIHPKIKEQYKPFSFPHYYQVFEERHGFVSDLSIIDLLFNLGPSARDYLNRITISE